MIREIKFRAWDTVNNQMLPVELIDFRNDLVSLNEGDNSLSDTSEMFILMQYTGSKDKNGVEGFHKDIWEFLNTIYIVEWDDKKAGFYLKNIHPRATEDDDIEMEHFSKGRIVGNKFENPELLETA